MSALVIGYGNPLRQDDGAGWAVVDALEQYCPNLRVKSLKAHQLTPELIIEFQGMSLVVFVDACVSIMSGMVVTWELTPIAVADRGFTHHCKPEHMLHQARELYGARPRGVMVTIGAERLEFGDDLSPTVQQAVSRAARSIKSLIETGANPLHRWAFQHQEAKEA